MRRKGWHLNEQGKLGVILFEGVEGGEGGIVVFYILCVYFQEFCLRYQV